MLNAVAVFFKESYQRMNIWRNVCENNPNHKKLQTIGETRWWAKHTALNRIFGSYRNHETSLYIDVILTLLSIEESNTFNPDVRVKARNFKESLLKFETILLAQTFLRIFSITELVSRYLQTSGLDLLKGYQLVSSAYDQLKSIQRGMDAIKAETDSFVKWASNEFEKRGAEVELQLHLPTRRIRHVKKLPGEMSSDAPIEDADYKFTVEIHNVVLDTVVESIEKRFQKNKELYLDLAFLSPASFETIKTGNIPRESLNFLSKTVSAFDPDVTRETLKEELIHFANAWEKLKNSIVDEYALKHFDNEDNIEEGCAASCSDTPEIPVSVPSTSCKSCKNCIVCCYKILIQYSLYSETYKALTSAYRYLLTLPTTQVACERTFSTLKFVKNRLRSSLSDNHLEALVLMSCEKNKLNTLDSDMIINRMSEHSSVMRKQLSLD